MEEIKEELQNISEAIEADEIVDEVIINPEETKSSNPLDSFYGTYELSDEEKEKIKEEIKADKMNDMRYTEILRIYSTYGKTYEELTETAFFIYQYETLMASIKDSKDIIPNFDEEEFNKMLHSENQEAEKELIDNMKKNFPYDNAKLLYALELVKNRMDDFSEDIKSTKFNIDELIYSNNKKKESLKSIKVSEKELVNENKRLDIIDDAINNVTNIDYILSKFNSNDKKFINALRKHLKHKSKSITDYASRIEKYFSIDKMKKIEDFMLKTDFGNEEFILFLIDFITERFKSGFTTGHYIYYRFLLSNLYDIEMGYYDIGDSNEYINLLKSLYEEYQKGLVLV